MTRPYVRLAAVAAMAVGVLLSTGPGLALADSDPGAKDHTSNGHSGHSEGKPSSASAGGSEGHSSSKPDKPSTGDSNSGSRDKSGSEGSSSNGSSNASSHSASKTKPGTSSSDGSSGSSDGSSGSSASGSSANGQDNEDRQNGSGSNSTGTQDTPVSDSGTGSNDSGSNDSGSNGSGSNDSGSNDSGSSIPTQTPSTPAAEQPAATENTAPADDSAPPVGAIWNNNTGVAASAPGLHLPVPPRTERTPPSPKSPHALGSTGSTAAVSAQSVPGPAPADPPAVKPALTSVQTWVTKAAGEFIESVKTALREVTLKDLALAALPGIAGLMFVFITGIGLGHRQARFGFVMETTGALRFAARGPLGVVRAGGFVAARTRKAFRPTNLEPVDRVA